MDNIDHYIQLSTFDALEKVADFSAFVDTTMAMNFEALQNYLLILVEGNTSALIQPYVLAIILEDYVLHLQHAWPYGWDEGITCGQQNTLLDHSNCLSLLYIDLLICVYKYL